MEQAQGTNTRSLKALTLTLLVEVAFIALAVLIGEQWAKLGGIIPQSIFPFPDAPLAVEDRYQVLLIFIGAQFLVSLVIGVFAGSGLFLNVKRTVLSIYGEVLLYAVVPLSIFLVVPIPFDPQLYACAAVTSFLFYIVAYGIGGVWQQDTSNFFTRSYELVFATIMTLKSRYGLLILVAILIPILTAHQFMVNRNFANLVTRIRLELSTTEVETDWSFVDRYEGVRFLQPMQVSEDASGMVYVLERAGRLYSLDPTSYEKTLLLDISSKVGEIITENGAQGFALDPGFNKDRPYLYLYYTDFNDPEVQRNRLSRFDLSQDTPEQSEFVLIEQERDKSGFHNGGTVLFGPDGYLYLSLGEMAEWDSHQAINRNLMGGILRIDINKGASHSIPKQPMNGYSQGYKIPDDNPFVGQEGVLEEFYALGLRNPFRISFDPETKKMWVGDVGSAEWEEVNIVKPGHNYQYPYIEGKSETGRERPSEILGKEDPPVYFYRHSAFDRAVIGGVVYRAEAHPNLVGQYIFGDNYSGKIFSLPSDTDGTKEPVILTRVDQVAQRGITSISQSQDGQIIITTLGRADMPTGRILRLISKSECAEISCDDNYITVQDDKPVSPEYAHMIFQENCSRCHGLNGRADGPDSNEMEVPVPDFASAEFQNSRSDEQLYRVIKYGGEAEGLSFWMPPWEGIVTDAEIKAMVTWIRSLDTSTASEEDTNNHHHE